MGRRVSFLVLRGLLCSAQQHTSRYQSNEGKNHQPCRWALTHLSVHISSPLALPLIPQTLTLAIRMGLASTHAAPVCAAHGPHNQAPELQAATNQLILKAIAPPKLLCKEPNKVRRGI